MFAPDLLMILYVNPKNHCSQPIYDIFPYIGLIFYGKLVGKYTVRPMIPVGNGVVNRAFFGGGAS